MLQITQTTLSIIFLYVFMFILKRTWIKVFEICYTEYFENYVHQVTFFVESLRSQTPKEYFYNKETASNLLIPLCNIFENVTRVYSTPPPPHPSAKCYGVTANLPSVIFKLNFLFILRLGMKGSNSHLAILSLSFRKFGRLFQ